jgi:hypothetical protein
MTPTGPDPSLSLPTAIQAMPGSNVVVPVNIDTARPDGSTGAVEAILALKYDPQVFDVSASGVQLGSLTSTAGWQVVTVVNAQTGEIGIDLFGATPIETTVGGSLITISLHVRDSAPAGASGLEIVNQVNPSGQRAFLTTVADAQGAFILHSTATSQGTLPGAPGQVTVSAVEPLTAALVTADQPLANLASSPARLEDETALRALPAMSNLDRVFADLGAMLAQVPEFGQMTHLLNAGAVDQSMPGGLEQTLLQQIGMVQQDWASDDIATTPDQPHRQASEIDATLDAEAAL